MVSFEVFFPKLLKVSTQTTINIIKFTIGKNNNITHQVGRFIIFIKMMAL